MSKSGLQKIIEKAMQKGSQPEPRSETAPEPVAKTPAEIEQAARTEHDNVVSRLRTAQTELVANERDLEGAEGGISRAIDLDARKGGGFYTEEARRKDESRRDALTAAVAENKRTVKTLENAEEKTREILRVAETKYLLSQVRDHEGNGKTIQEEMLRWRDKGLELFKTAKSEAAAADETSKKYQAICKQAGDLWENHGFAALIPQWRVITDTLSAQR